VVVHDEGWPQSEAGDLEAIARTFEELPAVVLTFSGAQLRVVAANRTARRTMGDRPDVVGRPIRDVMPDLEGQQMRPVTNRRFSTRATGVPVRTTPDSKSSPSAAVMSKKVLRVGFRRVV
jgi:hypothetical protein